MFLESWYSLVMTKKEVDTQYPTKVGVAINIMQLVDSGTIAVHRFVNNI